MTTIAYRDGILAADTLSTCGGGILSRKSVKVHRRGGIMWSASGDSAWGRKFHDWMAGGLAGDPPNLPDDNGGTGATIYLSDSEIAVFHENGWELRHGLPFWADGSGADYAMGAMQVGATAEEAVRVAMEWDHRTGGEILVLRRRAE